MRLSQPAARRGIPCEVVFKVNEGRPNTVDMIKNDQIQLIINTTEGKKAISDSFTMRREALQHRVTYYTTMAGARAACYALGELDAGNVNSLQDLHKSLT
jgi:carbamoyl-phosphate synthase large subunit